MSSVQLFTSESVCAGHPDKICDQISDSILDEVLAQDPNGRTAIETLVAADWVVLAGEVNTTAKLDFVQVARQQIERLGYTNPATGFSHLSPVTVLIHQQSSEIAQGVDQDGAGDQGMMFGYACRETEQLMPLPIILAHQLAQAVDTARELGVLEYLRPDGKTQVTVNYNNGQPVGIESVVVAVPHKESVELNQVREDILKQVVTPVIESTGLPFTPSKLLVNGTGTWHLGGPTADAGVTGRKIVVDTYGGYARVGGGCFSGKDASKVDRSGAYIARHLAKNIVAHGLAERAEVSLAFCIGQPRPVMKQVNTFDTARVAPQAITDFIDNIIDLSVKNIIEYLDLRRPVFLPTATYGHFGRDGFTWEKVVE